MNNGRVEGNTVNTCLFRVNLRGNSSEERMFGGVPFDEFRVGILGGDVDEGWILPRPRILVILEIVEQAWSVVEIEQIVDFSGFNFYF